MAAGSAPNWSPLGPSTGCYKGGTCGNTGWVDARVAVPVTGNYKLEIGVTNVGDSTFQSGLAYDLGNP